MQEFSFFKANRLEPNKAATMRTEKKRRKQNGNVCNYNESVRSLASAKANNIHLRVAILFLASPLQILRPVPLSLALYFSPQASRSYMISYKMCVFFSSLFQSLRSTCNRTTLVTL